MILCFDIGGTTIKIAEAFGPDDIRPTIRVPTPALDFTAFTSVLQSAIDAAPERPDCLAFSIAGVIDPETGIATVANIPCLSGRRLRSDLEAALGLPVVLGNDADCFALAEATIGAGRGHAVVFGIILGTGVGGGIVVRGRLINDSSASGGGSGGGFTGEWGHGPVAQRIVGDTVLPAFPCGCGQTGCLDAICSARGMEKLHLALGGVALTAEDIIAAWQAEEPAASRTIAIWLDLLSGPLAMVQNMLGAGVIAVGGGLSNARPLIDALDKAVRGRILQRLSRPLIVQAQCPIEPGLVGAAVLGLNRKRDG
ncbi:ROK family protein [Rhodobacter sp. 24-YEA-8]|uniref:ROK family protein n=1 Tax=Rhodobacter sp. 24-YEA-8 TaxID=1884310 RepID=UPI00089997E4|nr:ROK family protein [Rhodobacter sp. 24-YEA-8]SEC70469.1 N-acetylglucosamine kinase [Rhodobacter sp. 24-YEA-8]